MNKSDLQQIRNIFKEEVKPIIRDELKPVKQDISGLKSDVTSLKSDIKDIKTNLTNLTEFAMEAIGNLLEWTQEIHDTLVKEDLSKRVKKLEQTVFPKN